MNTLVASTVATTPKELLGLIPTKTALKKTKHSEIYVESRLGVVKVLIANFRTQLEKFAQELNRTLPGLRNLLVEVVPATGDTVITVKVIGSNYQTSAEMILEFMASLVDNIIDRLDKAY